MGIGSILAKSPFVKKVLGKVVRKGLSTAPKKMSEFLNPHIQKQLNRTNLKNLKK